MTLKELHRGQIAIVEETGGESNLRRHFLNLGLIPGTIVKIEKHAPLGDPIELHIHSYRLTVRKSDAEKIKIIPIKENKPSTETTSKSSFKATDNAPIDMNSNNAIKGVKKLSVALVGNQNSGKTTLFNALTDSNRHTGNFPGVTVDRKNGTVKEHKNITVTDLPGIYSLSPYSPEEIITREFILRERPDCIINVIDSTNIGRNFYLTMQLLELDTPIVLALNMIDEINANGGIIKIKDMQNILGVPVVPVSAAQNIGIDALINQAEQAAYKHTVPQVGNSLYNRSTNPVISAVTQIEKIINSSAKNAEIPLRFAAEKAVESDETVLKKLNLGKNEGKQIEKIIKNMESETGLDRIAAVANMRFSFIYGLCDKTVFLPKESAEEILSSRIDKILTGKYTAFPSFVLIMSLIFYITFNLAGPFFQKLLQTAIEKTALTTDRLLALSRVDYTLRSLIKDGIFSGVGSVLSFLPIIIILFFFLSLLEDSGYMARIAFITDKLLQKIGLSGRSIVPMLIGFGCTVPAVLASRTISSRRDKCFTVMLTPFMSCTAKLPVYGIIVQNFFPKYSGFIIVGLYFMGVAIAVIIALISKNLLFKGKPDPFVLELPNYRMPSAKSVFLLLIDKTKDFINRAFTIIFLASIIIWFLRTYDFGLNITSDSSNSILARLAGGIAPIFAPLGLNDWRLVTSLISGFTAKECVVSTLEVLTVGTALTSVMTSASALSMAVFCLLYTPCVAAVAAVKRELGIKWAAIIIVGQCCIAWVCALFARAIFILLTI